MSTTEQPKANRGPVMRTIGAMAPGILMAVLGIAIMTGVFGTVVNVRWNLIFGAVIIVCGVAMAIRGWRALQPVA